MTHDDASADPIARFAAPFARAAEDAPFDHTAMALGTCGADGQPAVRIVLLHGFDERGFTFYTNYESRKGRDIAANARAALTFYWPWLNEQVRAEGTLAPIAPEESDAYFATRERGRQLGAWASAQSRPIASREALLDAGRRGRGPLRRPRRAAAAALGRLPADAARGSSSGRTARSACTTASSTSASRRRSGR